jgi:hypothetical protein
LDIAKPFIRLPYSFDAAKLAAEISDLDDSAWMVHPTRMTGNSAVALLSRDGRDNDDFAGTMSETKHLASCPYVRQVMASFGEVLGRSRIMKLAAGSEVSQHVDFNYHWYARVRIHVPIITNPDVTFYCANEHINMRAGECWIFNNWRRHKVVNSSSEDRIHLVIDTAGSSRFWEQVRIMQQHDPIANRTEFEELVQAVPFVADKQVEILAERYNISPVMSPGELDALVAELIRDFEQNTQNDPDLVHKYKILLQNMTKDWRETWHLHGYEKEGWPRYQKIIDGVQEQLHPDMRALLTQSNQIGVNPIIVQRILRSALATDEIDQFMGTEESKS